MNRTQSFTDSMQSLEKSLKTNFVTKTPEKQSKELKPIPLDLERIEAEAEKATFGQRVADAMASKVGSWGFLIGQTAVLTGWVGMNLMPGVPHWDQSPFILLNLVFSFASAYTAPIVLMSQNRQSDIERKKTEYDHLVNRKSGHDIELLHQKFDQLHAQQLAELTRIIQMQNQQLQEIKSTLLPVLNTLQISKPQMQIDNIPMLPLPNQTSGVNTIKISDVKNFLPSSQQKYQYSLYIPSPYSLKVEHKKPLAN